MITRIISAIVGLGAIAVAVFARRSNFTKWVVTPVVATSLIVAGAAFYNASAPEPPLAFAAESTFVVNDDACEHRDDDNTMYLTQTTCNPSSGSTNDDNETGFRFTNVTVDKDATIQRAWLELYFSGHTTNGSEELDIWGEDADNSAVFTTTAGNLSGRTETTANEEGDPINIEDDTTDRFHQIEVTSIVQEIVNRGSWSSGNAMTFIILADAGDQVTVGMAEGSNDARLVVLTGSDTTGEQNPTNNTAGAGGGFTNASNAYTSNNSDATWTGAGGVSHVYYDFGFTGLDGATIDDIVLKLEGSADTTNDDHKYAYELSWDGGTSWTTLKYAGAQLTSADTVRRYGGGYDGYSHTFVPNDLTDANFRVRISSPDDTDNNDLQLDHLAVEVFYTGAAGGVSSTTVTTSLVDDIASTTATFNGVVATTTGTTSIGFAWGIESFTATTVTQTATPVTLGAYDYAATGLTAYRDYWVRAWASSTAGVNYGSTTRFFSADVADQVPEADGANNASWADSDFDDGTHATTTGTTVLQLQDTS